MGLAASQSEVRGAGRPYLQLVREAEAVGGGCGSRDWTAAQGVSVETTVSCAWRGSTGTQTPDAAGLGDPDNEAGFHSKGNAKPLEDSLFLAGEWLNFQ